MKKLYLSALAAVSAVMVMTGCTTVNNNDAANDFKAVMVPAKFESVITHKDTKVSGASANSRTAASKAATTASGSSRIRTRWSSRPPPSTPARRTTATCS